MEAVEGAHDELAVRLGRDLAGNFEPLMLAHQDRLYSFALRLCGNSQDAEEIVQDAFVKAYRAMAGYPAERTGALALRPWLYRITLNVYRNRVRRKRLAVVSLEGEADGGDPWGGAEKEPANPVRERPEAAAGQAELRRELAALVATLPERYRAAVVLRYVEGLSYAELAKTLAQPIGTVKANVYRGIQQLRRQMLAAVHDPQLEVPNEQ